MMKQPLLFNITRTCFFGFFILQALFLAACASPLSQGEAEQKAIDFINTRVRFFAKDQAENTTANITRAAINSISSYQESNLWVVVAHVRANLNNTVKQNDLIVKVDAKSGKVVEFNGVKVQEFR